MTSAFCSGSDILQLRGRYGTTAIRRLLAINLQMVKHEARRVWSIRLKYTTKQHALTKPVRSVEYFIVLHSFERILAVDGHRLRFHRARKCLCNGF